MAYFPEGIPEPDNSQSSSRAPFLRRRVVLTIASGLIAAGLGLAVVSGVAGEVQAAQSRSQARIDHGDVQLAVLKGTDVAATELSTLEDPMASARELYASSVGRVLTDRSRLELNAAIVSADEAIVSARAGISTAIAAARIELPDTVSTAEIEGATAKLSDRQLEIGSVVDEVGELVERRSAAVTEAVIQWQAEQDRLAAEQSAAALAAEQAAAAAAAEAQQLRLEEAAAAARSAAPPASAAKHSTVAPGAPQSAAPIAAAPAAPNAPPAPPAPPAAHVETVWASGFQTEIDACRGSVDLTARYGTAVIGEHWDCGGSAFPKSEGALIQLGGILSGTYRTGPVVAVLDKAVATTDDVPRGYDLLYQTCIDNSNSRMSFTVLTRVD